MIQKGRSFTKLFWLLMAIHILWVGAEFPEALDEVPVQGYAIFERSPEPPFLKKIKSLPGIPEKMTQEEVLEYPDFVAVGLKSRSCLSPVVFLFTDTLIPFKESKLHAVHPEGHYPPPKANFC